ncbi:UDP-glycosyltransferase 1-like [Gastrolobium bilobum]|uniref:UDP-glycosyltransferase 1-like n=1 Tax=Gastrolobium bilobum TaxID=150636 RepID=UPI002AB09281|nr:UDP-glycosyltransferase 1-like [Gastrolobium bilobum]
MIMKDTIVLYPALGIGHLVSMVELGKLILTHNPSFSIISLIHTPPNNSNHNNQHTTSTTTFDCDSTSQYMATISPTVPSITFHHIPPPISFPASTTLPPHILTIQLCHHNNQYVGHVLQSISETTNLKAIVMDFFNYSATQVTATLNIPSYFYYTSGASCFAMQLHLPTIHQNTTKSIKDLQMHLQIPGVPKILPTDLPTEVHDRASQSYQVHLVIATSMRDSDGVIINTFDAIEGRVIRALSAGLCLPKGTTPPVFCIGPLISPPCRDEDESGCLSWLDSQPSQSVVLLIFGSMGWFSRTQLKEIAIGLEKSEQRFLWVVRSELDRVNPEPSLEELMPEGFLERTKERGLVVKNWAPQVAILSHNSVGGFVTHCGWNSVLEAICEGVPMVTWPLYAEQKFNRVILVEEMKVALALNESKDGFVTATELRDRVKELMDSDKGNEIRKRILNMKTSALEARAHGGSSPVALNKLAQLWK